MENTYIPCSGPSDSVDHGEYLHSLFRSIRLCEMKVMKNTHLPCSGQSDSVDHGEYLHSLFRSIRLCEMKVMKNTHLPCSNLSDCGMKIMNNTYLPCSGQSDSADHGGHAEICHCLVPAESESVGMIASPRKLAGLRLRSHGRS